MKIAQEIRVLFQKIQEAAPNKTALIRPNIPYHVKLSK